MAFWQGGNTLKISAELFIENRQRLLQAFCNKASKFGAILLQGGSTENRYNTDANDLPFRQESYFFWTFGVHESDCFGVIDLTTKKSILFPPKLDPEYEIWEGKIETESWFKEKYKVDEVHFHKNTEGISDYLNLAGIKNLFEIDIVQLYPVIANLRVFKTDSELEVMRYSNAIAVEAHKEVMRHIRPNMYEYQLESLFRHISYYTGGCRHLAYTCIAATGMNSAILHYGHPNAPNSKLIKDGDMCLFDMGPEYNCYASDVTCSFPANGKFTEKQKIVYNAVYNANIAVFNNAKPGVRWTEMHKLAERTILIELEKAGLVQGSIEEMVNARLGAVFMPHGLGHFIGLDVHDCGGYLDDALTRSDLPGLKNLRTTRILKERMVITIEPGCYFIDTLLNRAFNTPALSKFLIADKINEFRGTGGVRIEDVVVIWTKGNENLNAKLPRKIEEIEEFMSKIKQ